MKSIKRLTVVMILGMLAAVVQAAGPLVAENAWVREAPPGATALAGYVTLKNDGDKPLVLVAADSPVFGSVMLHRTVMQDGMAKMLHQATIEIPAHGSVTFEPNDYHLMLMKPKQPLKAGDRVDITLKFNNGESVVVSHEVRAGMEGDMGGHGAMAGMAGMDHGQMKH
jgi:hypothetical protein